MHNRKYLYGITPDEYAKLMAEQGGVCAICWLPERGRRRQSSLSVDHNHETGQVRGLLCSRCNSTLGYMNDEPTRLRAAADYLEHHAG